MDLESQHDRVLCYDAVRRCEDVCVCGGGGLRRSCGLFTQWQRKLVSVEGLVHRLIHEKLAKSWHHPGLSGGISGMSTASSFRLPSDAATIGRRSLVRAKSDRSPCVADRHERYLRDGTA